MIDAMIVETDNKKWPVGVQFNNVGKTDAAERYPDCVRVKKYFETSGQDVVLLGVGRESFAIPVSMAELIYQRAGTNRPTLF